VKHKIAISVNTAWNIYNFRSGLVKAFISHGYEVLVIAPHDEYSQRIRNLGCRFIPMPMDNNRTRPLNDLSLLARYFATLRSERPLAYLGFTVKPNVYGSLAAHVLQIPVINNIAGLGTTFINKTFLTQIVRALYKLSLRRSYRVFFQNRDDRDVFLAAGLAQPSSADWIPGSGVDLARYNPAPRSEHGHSLHFLLVARMLKDKGIFEYVEAARIVHRRFPSVRFELLGFVDEANPNSVGLNDIRNWEEEGAVHYLGKSDDVRPYLTDTDCVVLPSYREGISRSLLEAAAMGRPIITTDTVGCRDVVDDHVNGLLCRVRDGADLAEKMCEFVALPDAKRSEMGDAGRKKVASEYDENIVIQKYLHVLDEIARSQTHRKGVHNPLPAVRRE
jgi:glycosyltransferase involved in cell wall biosynthesis